MSLRPVIAAAAMVLLAIGNIFLVWLELSPDESGQNRIAPAEVKTRHQKARPDPLFDMRFTRSEREANFKKMGMPVSLVKRTMTAIEQLESRYGDRIDAAMDDAQDPQDLADALCGKSNDLRPRYGALRFLVEQDRGARKVIDIRRVSTLRRQEWSRADLVGQVYEELELGDDRKPDAPLMAIAAVLAGKEEQAIESRAPWDRALVGTWSWDRVVKEFPGTDEKVVDYFAMMHLVVEMAQAEGGLCNN